jgi:hypothetical protein
MKLYLSGSRCYWGPKLPLSFSPDGDVDAHVSLMAIRDSIPLGERHSHSYLIRASAAT